MIDRIAQSARSRSVAMLQSLDDRLGHILICWVIGAGTACIARYSLSAQPIGGAGFSTVGSYALVIVAPMVSTVLALRWFRDGDKQPMPRIRLAVFGQWQSVSRGDARRHSLYGASGIMVSLLIGVMLNVPLRAAEYLAAMPPLPIGAPRWLSAMHLAMTFDVVLFGSFYMIAFVAALRHVPLFPRLLVAVWIGDLAMQLLTAQMVSSAGGLPTVVASALRNVLYGNVEKVLISMVIWLPYLLLSKRVNVTYRNRIAID